MRKRKLGRGLWALSAAGALLLATLVVAAPALATQAVENCPGNQTLVSLEEKTCPANANRPPIVVKRACCQNPAGKIHCKHFPHCPKKSPS